MKPSRLTCASFVALLWAASSGCVSSNPQPRTTGEDLDAVYDRALAAIESSEWSSAIRDLEYLKELHPRDLVIRSRLLVCWQNSGKLAKRDREHEEIRSLWASFDSADRENYFLRDYFQASGQVVEVVEYLVLEGERPIRYVFTVYEPEGSAPSTMISLGSYELTTVFMRQAGELARDERAFHLDQYTDQSHWTWAFFKGEPEYDDVRDIVEEILAGSRKPLSSSVSR